MLQSPLDSQGIKSFQAPCVQARKQNCSRACMSCLPARRPGTSAYLLLTFGEAEIVHSLDKVSSSSGRIGFLVYL